MSSRSRWFARIVFLLFRCRNRRWIGLPALYAQGCAYAHNFPSASWRITAIGASIRRPRTAMRQIPYHKLTHINHAGVSFNADGSLSVPRDSSSRNSTIARTWRE